MADDMPDDMIDDIKKLLDGDFGDDRILKEIYRACQNNEAISNYERKYVHDLTDRYLYHPNKEVSQTTSEQNNTDTTPDVILPEKLSVTKKTASMQSHDYAAMAPSDTADENSVRLISSSNKKIAPKSKLVFAGIAVLVVVAATAAIVVMSEPSNDIPIDDVPANDDATILGEFNVQTDLDAYRVGDLVSISGWHDTAGRTIDLVIIDPTGAIIWSESVTVKSDGAYSTLTIAGGDTRWEQPGTFTVRADANGSDDDDDDMAITEFEILAD